MCIHSLNKADRERSMERDRMTQSLDGGRESGGSLDRRKERINVGGIK